MYFYYQLSEMLLNCCYSLQAGGTVYWLLQQFLNNTCTFPQHTENQQVFLIDLCFNLFTHLISLVLWKKKNHQGLCIIMSHFSKLLLLKLWKISLMSLRAFSHWKKTTLWNWKFQVCHLHQEIKDRELNLKSNAGFKQTTILSEMEQSQNQYFR